MKCPLVSILLLGLLTVAGPLQAQQLMPPGDPAKGRLVFGPCRTCHYPEAAMGHNNGPNLSPTSSRPQCASPDRARIMLAPIF